MHSRLNATFRSDHIAGRTQAIDHELKIGAWIHRLRQGRIYTLIAELSYIIRWLALWLISQLLRLTPLKNARRQRITIRIGNALFSPAVPYDAYRSFDSYVTTHAAQLDGFAEVLSCDQWVPHRSILDVGSGLGQYTDKLARLGAETVIGLEYQVAKAVWASKQPRHSGVKFVVGSAEDMPFDSHTFDVVFSHTVFEHIADVERALGELRRVLKPDGVALISYNFYHHRGGHHLFPYVHFPWATWIADESELCRFWSDELARDQRNETMKFYEEGTRLRSLSEGAEIHLNRLNFDQFELCVRCAQLQIVKRLPTEQLARLCPWLLRVPRLRYFIAGTMYYVLAPTEETRSATRLAA